MLNKYYFKNYLTNKFNFTKKNSAIYAEESSKATTEDQAAKALKGLVDFTKSIGDGILKFYTDLAAAVKSNQK